MNTDLNVAKQVISMFMRDVNKSNQEVRESFCRSELANTQKFAELDRDVAEFGVQVSRVANITSIQHNNSASTDEIQVQPGQSDNNAVSEPCSSNSSFMIGSVEIGCSHGMNGNALNCDVCSVTPINISVPTVGGQILPELFLPTFSSREQSTVHFLKTLISTSS
jgi:hypothetical protein